MFLFAQKGYSKHYRDQSVNEAITYRKNYMLFAILEMR